MKRLGTFWKLLMFWPRLLGQMITSVVQRMPLKLEEQERQIAELKSRLAIAEKMLNEKNLELLRRRPGGFRLAHESHSSQSSQGVSQ